MEALLAPSLEAAGKQQEGHPDEKVFFIADHVFLGSKFGAADRALLDALGISAVVNLTAGRSRVPNHFEGQGIEYLHIELSDELLSSPSPAIPRACRAIHKWGQDQQRVLVHCQAGLSRSVTAVLAWLMRHKGLSLMESSDLLVRSRGRRPRCNPSFWCYLAALERELGGWPSGTPPSFDFTAWLLEDLRGMGMKQPEGELRSALRDAADWVDFTSFYTALSGSGFKTLMAAQRVAQQPMPSVSLACKAASAALELMEVYRAWPALLVYSMRILQPLVAHMDSRPSDYIFSSGGIGKTVNVMGAHPADVDVQESGCVLLAYLAGRSTKYAAEVLLLGGMQATVEAMRAHLASTAVQAVGCITLQALLHTPEAVARMLSLGGVEALLNAMRVHLAEAKVQEFGCRAMRTLMVNTGAMAKAADLGGAAVLRMAVQEYPGNEAVRLSAGRVLATLDGLGATLEGSDKEGGKAAVGAKGGNAGAGSPTARLRGA